MGILKRKKAGSFASPFVMKKTGVRHHKEPHSGFFIRLYFTRGSAYS